MVSFDGQVRWPVLAKRDDSPDHCTQATKERKLQWIHPDFETHGQSHPKSKTWGILVAPQNGHGSNKNFEKNEVKGSTYLASSICRASLSI